MIQWRVALTRIRALMFKESLQLLRDRATFGMLLGIPHLQIALFGCAIELSPHSLEVTIVASETARFARLEHLLLSQTEAAQITRAPSLPLAFKRQKRGETLLVIDADAHPPVLYLDATNPVLATHAELSIERIVRAVSGPVEEEGALPRYRLQRLYNSALRTQPFLVTGLLGVVLTMSLGMLSALTVARERERGTLDGLLGTPVRPLELWVGKLAPYVLFGVLQAALIAALGVLGFDIHARGSITLLALATLIFAAANLALGFVFSCLARQQMQAMQMTFFFFLPSSLLSGFMFPFRAMPRWAQLLAETLPLTHFLRIVRGIVLRGVDTAFVLRNPCPATRWVTSGCRGCVPRRKVKLGASFRQDAMGPCAVKDPTHVRMHFARDRGIPSASEIARLAERVGQSKDRSRRTNVDGKSDRSVMPAKSRNKADCFTAKPEGRAPRGLGLLAIYGGRR
jgi:ABC-2 type transport system permease protein